VNEPIRIGVVAGTIPRLAQGILAPLAGVERILHAGGIGPAAALEQLGAIAPVVAVVADRDFVTFGDRFPEVAELAVGGAQIVMTAMAGTPPRWLAPVARRLASAPPDVLIHSDGGAPTVGWYGGTLVVNPGRAGLEPAAGRRASCAVLMIEGPGRIAAQIVESSG
jgi:predicted phosphodiesterase